MTVPITDPLVEAIAERLRSERFSYTARQLYYAVCEEIVEPPRPQGRGMIAAGVLVIVFGALVARSRSLPAVLVMSAGMGLALVIVGGLTVHWDAQRRAQPRSRMLPLGFPEFVDAYIAPLRRRPGGLAGLVEAAPARSAPRVPRTAMLLVADSEETAMLLRANAEHLPGAVAVVSEAEALKRLRGRTAVAVHDADPRGCELPARLRDAGAASVGDAGLRPPSSDADLPVIQGAPARLPRDLGNDLDAAAIAWLRSGRRLELAALSPERVCALVGDAVAALREPARSSS